MKRFLPALLALVSTPALAAPATVAVAFDRQSIRPVLAEGLADKATSRAVTADDPVRHLYALAARVPMGQADRYAVLTAPTLTARVDVLLDAIATVTAMVDFQLSADDGQ